MKVNCEMEHITTGCSGRFATRPAAEPRRYAREKRSQWGGPYQLDRKAGLLSYKPGYYIR